MGLLFLAAAALAEPATRANWIWYPEDPAVEGAGQTRYLRRSLTLDAAPAKAILRARWDDGATFTVNGQPPPRPAASGRDGSLYDLTALLKPGENVLGFAVMNSIGMGGLIVSAELTTGDGKTQGLYSDTLWRAAKEPAAGWDAPGFDDQAWPAARIVGNVFAPPWYRHPAFDMEPFLAPGEAAAYAAWREQRIALPPGLDREKDAAARFVQADGHCALVIDGTPRPPLLYRGTVDPLTDHGARQIALFRDAGVHVFTAYYHLASCRPKPGVYDFSRLDEVVRAYLATDPRAYLVLVLHLVPPSWWMDQHPADLVRYAAGDDYNSTDEALRVRVPSLASQAWFDDSADLWRRCLEHLERQPWGKRIIGYQPGYGIYTEWHYYGSWTEQMPDTGAAMTGQFRAWLTRKYGNDAKLQAAWSDPHTTLAAAGVPRAEPRVAAAALGLRDPRKQAWAIDYYRCQQELTAQRVEQFCGLTKKLTGGRALAGAFYGYYEGVPPQTQGGHLELPKLINSPVMDYFAAPYDYSHRLMGDDGRTRAVVDAFALAGKTHLIEDDTRTSLHPVDEYGRAPDEAASIAATRRMFGTALVHRTALWWCDFGASGGGGWYDDPALIGEVKRLYELAERRLARPAADVAQVALIADPEGCYYVADGPAMRTHYALVDRVTGALHRTGAPFDFLLVSQLGKADLTRYKVLVFLDLLHADAAQRAVLKRAVAGRAAIWLWAPGITDGKRFGPELVQDLIGVPVALRGDGVTASEAVVGPGVAFTSGLPLRGVDELVTPAPTPVAAAAELASWYNPRDAETMQRSYSVYEVSAAEGGIDWRVATTDGWSDVHLKAAVPACDGIGLTVTATDALIGTGLRVVVKDADAAEFASEVQPLSGASQTWSLALAGFARAPWYKGPAERVRFPLTGFKLVLYGLPGGRAGTLRVRALAALRGAVRHTDVRLYDGPGLPQTCLTVPDADALLAAREGPAPVFFSALAALPLPVLTAVLDQCGVHRYVTRPDVLVQADSTLLMLHTATGGRCTIRLPRPERLTDALTGEVVGEGASLDVELPAPSTRLFERLPVRP